MSPSSLSIRFCALLALSGISAWAGQGDVPGPADELMVLDRISPDGDDAHVIARELGHAVFQSAFAGGLEEPCVAADAGENQNDPWFVGRLGHELVIGGFNEGFADWLSFVVTGDTDPSSGIEVAADPELTRDVPDRRMTEDNFRWGQIVEVGDEGASATRCMGKYCVGTLFARSLVAAYQATGRDLGDVLARQEYSRAVVSALEGTLARMEEKELPLPGPEVARCERREDVSADEDPPLIGAFLQAFLRGLPPIDAASVCRQLEARFEAGFPSEFRQDCRR